MNECCSYYTTTRITYLYEIPVPFTLHTCCMILFRVFLHVTINHHGFYREPANAGRYTLFLSKNCSTGTCTTGSSAWYQYRWALCGYRSSPEIQRGFELRLTKKWQRVWGLREWLSNFSMWKGKGRESRRSMSPHMIWPEAPSSPALKGGLECYLPRVVLVR